MRLALVLALAFAAPAEACRLALVLALDVSGSVDRREYRLQLDGIAAALEDEAVERALLALPGAPVALSVFEWSGARYQRIVLGWTLLEDAGGIGRVAGHLRGWSRIVAPEATGIGTALLEAERQLGRAPECWRQVVDVSGDGRNNDWPQPESVRDAGRLGQATINALVVGRSGVESSEVGRSGAADVFALSAGALAAYFRSQVIRGPEAFVEEAQGYEAYAEAMRRKLLREIGVLALGRMEVPR